MSENFKIVSSQYKHLLHYDESVIDPRTINSASALKNEPFSFQALYRMDGGLKSHRVSVWVETDLPVKAYRVDYVPVQHASVSESGVEYESREAGLYPDMLTPRPAKPEIVGVGWAKNHYYEKDVDATLNASIYCFRPVWFTINPDSLTLEAGEYKIKVGMTSLNKNEVVAEEIFTLRVIDSALPEPDYFYTNWFHIDCVADMYGVKPYTPTFYRVFDEYIRNMTAHRQNTLLLPAFTPALDTEVGEERMNVQLVDIERTEDSWSFGFQRMRRFVRHAKKCGIKYFEHCHLFSQWGAKAAPNIYDNTGKRIFGYDTAATGKEYSEFIRAYLRAFLDFAAEEGIKDSLIFHISDEPTANQKADYRAAREVISEVLSGYPISDAMFDCSFYDEGIVEQPILSMYYYNDIEEASCPSAWLYYTGGELDTSNRKITNTAAATRVLGLHMYKYKSLGFLHWAYNFYYDLSSIGFADPKINPCAYRLFPGVVYLAYPINEKGRRTVVPSIREKLMAEAMDDLRALRLLEARIGREAVISLCEEKLGRINVRIIPTGESLRELREIINAKLSE